MAGVTLTVTDDAVVAALARLVGAASDLSPVMSSIAAYLVTSTQRHFERELGPDGKWQPLSPRTANRRVGRSRRRGTANILRVTNRLYSSITGDSDERQAQVGTNVVYAGIHQFGGTIAMPEREQTINLSTGKRKRFTKAGAKRSKPQAVTIGAHSITIPARPFLYLDTADVAEIERIAAESLGSRAGLDGLTP